MLTWAPQPAADSHDFLMKSQNTRDNLQSLLVLQSLYLSWLYLQQSYYRDISASDCFWQPSHSGSRKLVLLMSKARARAAYSTFSPFWWVQWHLLSLLSI